MRDGVHWLLFVERLWDRDLPSQLSDLAERTDLTPLQRVQIAEARQAVAEARLSLFPED